MISMHNQIRLIDNSFVPQKLQDKTLSEKYEYLRRIYKLGSTHILLNNISVFGPYPQPNVPWDISEVEKIAIYNPEVAKVLTWIKTKIIINLGVLDYKTLDVLIRIATGMLNKCDIPKEVQIMFHDNMVENLTTEHADILLSELPF